MADKRRSTRLDLESQIVIKRLDGKENATADINIRDLSTTGIGFECGLQLMVGSVYECDLIIWTKEKIHSFIEIVRVNQKGGTYSYGGIFIGMSEMDMSRIQVYTSFEERGLH